MSDGRDTAADPVANERLERFFRVVWRFNALAIAALAVLGVGLALFAVVQILADLARDRSASNTARPPAPSTQGDATAPAPVAGETFTIGAFTQLPGNSLFWAPVQAEQRFRRGYMSSKTAHSVRNYIFYDPARGTYRRLLPNERRVILAAHPIRRQARGGPRPTLALLFEVVEHDTNIDGIFNHSDRRALMVARVDGSNLTTVIDDVTRLQGSAVIGRNEVVLFFTRAGKTTAAHITLDAFHRLKSVHIGEAQQEAAQSTPAGVESD